MARKKGWRSKTRGRPHLTWVVDEASGVTAPTHNVADNDNLCNDNDWGDSTSKNKVLVRRVIFECWWTPTTPLAGANGSASFNVDFALVATSPDEMAAITTAGLTAISLYPTGARVIRSTTKNFTELSSHTSVGVIHPRPGPRWSCNLRTRFVLTEPQALYFYQKRVDIDSTSDSYEYSYRARCLVQKLD